jgi:hypothetical protein
VALSGFNEKLARNDEEAKFYFVPHCSVRHKCIAVWRCCGSHAPIKRKKTAGISIWSQSQFRVRASLMVSVINITSQKNPAPAKTQMSGRL